ncbi:MAG: hypothetical protein JGK17_22450 [Microcoleus sp. PH2017_10_PVI_O_A]|uniref:hypothetical protein n=1 Tax=unclassified Microcoleus TaxID=2642155 RepID=UPI001E1108FC|nr:MULTISPECIES: hypothetical protein [unclassified Microcoleus]TAE76224.1 MAG: hypothetical protein EAZ83_28530 [Oscillatoriales cyanobacterium]MCC3408299.1 hypothetical protein [Microcoleus sp. PH2017_10_PVI_O_A]MCC3461629.1 hypothetical protein [Microcoleus sp. PH2017_11_PCY_U_A]MCC3480860.1 hypothetical protein [Microcoleus sp. PH2017_12_PCY_D_A]MCC3530767.1 hypothetical protein [Microcoleus sp. PH2017_21_RUC_O_A]
MINSTGYFFALGFAAISAVTACPCQAQTAVESNINVRGENNLTTAESQNGAKTSAGDRPKALNTSKSFAVSETNTVPAQPTSTAAAPENQAVRSNPLGCRFFDTPSMRQ